MSRIKTAFKTAASENRAAFIPYLTAGFPTKESFMSHATTLLEHGDILEVGLPYSDPLGDGPTIQKSSEAALEQGMTTQDSFDYIRELRKNSDKAIVMMTYYNPIYCHKDGEEGFLKELKESGGDGIILPDLPPDQGETLIEAARALDLDTIFLVAPTSTDERLKLVTDACRGFIYAVSVTGVTGARDAQAADVPSLVSRTKTVSDLPVAVGFGVKNAATAAPVAAVADGVVVGSALISKLAGGDSVDDLAAEIAGACKR